MFVTNAVSVHHGAVAVGAVGAVVLFVFGSVKVHLLLLSNGLLRDDLGEALEAGSL